MPSLCTFVEITMIRTIEHIQSIQDIFAGMRVYDVQENSDTEPMSGIDKFHKFFWGAYMY
jgi:hypothetical protein